MNFEWDARTAFGNVRKHGVQFAEAAEVFGDALSSTVQDPDHSEGEAGLLIFGRTRAGRHLVESFVERGGAFRIISARGMTRSEQQAYER